MKENCAHSLRIFPYLDEDTMPCMMGHGGNTIVVNGGSRSMAAKKCPMCQGEEFYEGNIKSFGDVFISLGIFS
jgi:hypothetical protein